MFNVQLDSFGQLTKDAHMHNLTIPIQN